ncbi:hypothetical protein LV164_007205 [Aspergillus fumigatus]|nr:hypothetical protein KXX14_003996 [Aspergillus fumigatus]KAH1451427.1 hypothetical protein KXX58_004067 [Aspergillus fumigatus]KAH1486538.1 hypothetical protein KXX42_004869 [Aspergillus fumigatus]KAH1501839.1 hypothetical protein KXX06_001105 [Aspergillus fumigatus]KAH1541012.1 hypothetical protein KXX57_006658 [Aspergillus fumigatus]
MATQVSLFSYLQAAPPVIPASPPSNPSRNTTNTAYGADDIRSTAVWPGFDLQTILQRYEALLMQVQLPADPMPISPSRGVPTETALREKLDVYPRVRRALRAAFQHLATVGQMNGSTALEFGSGDFAKVIDGFRPDTAYFVSALPSATGPNRAPGDIKPSWKWSTAMASHRIPGYRAEYRQALSQVNFYMKQHRSRYGFILTDRELVVFRRRDNNGNLELASPTPFTAGGTAQQPQLTVLMALWYLGMLAAQDQGVDRWYL